jgi:hypothetical protein
MPHLSLMMLVAEALFSQREISAGVKLWAWEMKNSEERKRLPPHFFIGAIM